MPFLRCYRITPHKYFTLNNRWYDKVWPKHTLFFIPLNDFQLQLWTNFLCLEHHRSYLFSHLCEVHYSTMKIRNLPTNLQLYRHRLREIMIRDYNFVDVELLRTKRVYKSNKVK